MKKVITTALMGGVAAAAVAAALGGAGAANASCASLNGQSIGAGCTTGTGGFSLALGPAAATAAGPGNIAIAVGNPGFNRFYGTNVPTQALADGGTGNVAVALGDGSNAGSRGNHNTAFAWGRAATPSPTAATTATFRSRAITTPRSRWPTVARPERWANTSSPPPSAVVGT